MQQRRGNRRSGDPWQEQAACRGPQSVVFFPPHHVERKDERLSRERRAKAICASCPVLRAMPRLRPDDPGAPRDLGRAERDGAAGSARGRVRHGVTDADGDRPDGAPSGAESATPSAGAATRSRGRGRPPVDRSSGSGPGSRTGRRSTASSARACRWCSPTAGRSGSTRTRPCCTAWPSRAARCSPRRCPASGARPACPARTSAWPGYAAWLEEFVRAVGIDEKVVIVGHSFGGGVAIRVAHDFPDLARSLVLVNSIGGSSWKRGKVLTSIAERPLWDWGLHFPSDVWPIRQATRVLPVILEDALPNLLRSPGSVVKVANMARRADLRPELEELKRRRVPGDGHLGQPGRHHPQGVLRGDVHRGRHDGHGGRGQPLVAARRSRPLRRGHHQRPAGGQAGPPDGGRVRRPPRSPARCAGCSAGPAARPRRSSRRSTRPVRADAGGQAGLRLRTGRRGPAMRRSPRRRVMPGRRAR